MVTLDKRLLNAMLGQPDAARSVLSEEGVLVRAFQLQETFRHHPAPDDAIPKAVANSMIGRPLKADFAPAAWAEVAKAVQVFSEDLAVILRGTERQLSKLARQRAGFKPLGLALVPVSQPDGRLESLVVADEPGAVLRLATQLLLDRARGLSARLRCCAFDECGKYFLQPPRKRSLVYCTDAHREIAHDRGAKDRVRKYRKKVREQQRRGR